MNNENNENTFNGREGIEKSLVFEYGAETIDQEYFEKNIIPASLEEVIKLALNAKDIQQFRNKQLQINSNDSNSESFNDPENYLDKDFEDFWENNLPVLSPDEMQNLNDFLDTIPLENTNSNFNTINSDNKSDDIILNKFAKQPNPREQIKKSIKIIPFSKKNK
jgi:hypothetical protein